MSPREIPASVTVEVRAELLVDAAALILQAVECDAFDDATENAELATWRMLAEANGCEGEAFWRDPLVVEAYARAYERLADHVEDWRRLADDTRSRGSVVDRVVAGNG